METQWIINAAADASIYLLLAIGFALVLRTVHFFDFSFAALICTAPYAGLAWQNLVGANVGATIFCSTLTTVALALVLDLCAFAPLRARNASQTAPLLVSLGLLLALRNVLAAIWGDEARLLQAQNVVTGLSFLGGRITTLQIWTILAAVLLGTAIGALLKISKLGLCIRAVGDDLGLATSFGVSRPLAIGSVYVIAAITAAVAGLSLALDVGTTPTLGFRPFLFGVVAVILARTFSVLRLVAASVFVAFIQNAILSRIGPQWQEGGIFAIFLVVVVTRSFSKERLGQVEAAK